MTAGASTQTAPDLPMDTDRRWLLGAMILYGLLYAAFYPTMYTSIDEASTFSFAYVLRQGTIFPADTPAFGAATFFPELSPYGPHGLVYRFPIGFPALLAAVSWVSWRGFFLLNPLLHLVATGCFARLLSLSRVTPRYAGLYLLYPSFVLFSRTLFSDAFAASLTTIALYFLAVRRAPFPAGLCLGLALTARSVSVFVFGILLLSLLIGDWQERRQMPLWKGQSARFFLGLLPFLVLTAVYNFGAMGSPFRSTYTADALSWQGLAQSGPCYLLALLLIYPGMLLAPFLGRGLLWKEGLAATTLVLLVATSYNESTFGNNFAQTLLSTPRQMLPVMPFYLLAYCTLLARWALLLGSSRPRVEGLVAGGLLLSGLGISVMHQRYLVSLQTIHAEIRRVLPAHCVVYANKDSYKLFQPIWDRPRYRELPYVNRAEYLVDRQTGPIFAVVYMRSRGFTGEDQTNAQMLRDLKSRFVLADGPVSASPQVQYYRVLGFQERS